MENRSICSCVSFLVIGLFISCFNCPSNATSTDSSYPAFEYVYPDQSIWTTKRDPNGILQNPLLKVAESLFSSLQVAWTAKPYPANRMFKRLEEGKSNFSFLVRAPRLKESCIFSEMPVTYSELRVYRKSGVSPISKLNDLNKKQVITIRGYSYGKIGKYLKDPVNNIIIYEAPQHESAFSMLSHARADYLLDYSGPSEEVLEAEPIPDVSFDVLARLDVFLVLSKKYPNAYEMMGSLEEASQEIDVTKWGLKKP